MPKNNREQLIELMERYRLDIPAVARLTLRSPLTVTSWLRPETSKSHRAMPDWAVDMLRIKTDDYRTELLRRKLLR